MSSTTFSVVHKTFGRSTSLDAPGRAVASASMAAGEALSQFQPDEFRRAARVEKPSEDENSSRHRLGAIVDELLWAASLLPWRRILLGIIAGGLVAACVVPAAMFMARPRPPCELHEVRGSIVFGTTVPVGARIVLTPQDGGWPYDSFPTATVGKDGMFRVGTFGSEDGAPSGTYVATVQWFPISPDGTVGRNALPATYASPTTSPLSVTVSADSGVLHPMRIRG